MGSHLCCGARGAVGGSVPCSRAPQSWYWGWRERSTFTPPTYNSCRTWDSNSQPLGYESNPLTIRPRLPQVSSNPNQTHLNQLIKVLLGILETPGQVCWGKLELNSAGQRPSRTECGDPCLKGIVKKNLKFYDHLLIPMLFQSYKHLFFFCRKQKKLVWTILVAKQFGLPLTSIIWTRKTFNIFLYIPEKKSHTGLKQPEGEWTMTENIFFWWISYKLYIPDDLE